MLQRTKAPRMFSSCPKKPETVNSGGRNKPKVSFSRCASCLESIQLSVCSACLCVRCGLGPSGQSRSATQRPVGATAPTSGRHVPHHRLHFSSLPHPCFHPPLFFFASANYKHMRPCGSTDCCQASRLLFPLSSALWHAGRFMPPPLKGASTLLLVLLGGPQEAALLGKWGGNGGKVTRMSLFKAFLSNMTLSRDCAHRKFWL